MNNQLLHSYKNGNYTVNLFADGTKEKFTDDDFFKADFPDSMDLKKSSSVNFSLVPSAKRFTV